MIRGCIRDRPCQPKKGNGWRSEMGHSSMNSVLARIAARFTPLLPLSVIKGPSESLLRQVNSLESQLGDLSAEQLRKNCLALKFRARSGESFFRLLPDAYALVREAAHRT